MSTGPDESSTRSRTECSVCGNTELETLVELPGLPLTARFVESAPTSMPPGVDQRLLWCSHCGQGQLAVVVDASELYGEGYSFRTSESATATGGAAFFFETLEQYAPGRQFDTVIDVGCNDTYHLEYMDGRARRRIGIDPIWAGREHEAPEGIEVIGATVEESGLEDLLDGPPDLIIATHTFEHIPDPLSVFQSLMAFAGPDTLFLIETPGFDALVRRHRFDQVFHEHLQYFSAASYGHLIHRIGAVGLGIHENYHHWGALVVAFKKNTGPQGSAPPPQTTWTAAGIKERFGLFNEAAKTSGRALESLDGPIYGYGAALLLPIVAYHMDTDLGTLEAVLDDDPGKDLRHYWNLPLNIATPDRHPDWRDGTVLLTALDNVQPIMKKLLDRRPRHIIYPLHIM